MVAAELGAEPADVDVDRPRTSEVVVAPDLLQELGAGEHAARVLHEEHEGAFANKTERLAQEAKADKRKWRHFWDLKDAFHSLRHAYAITAHRAQGSTYEHAYVDWRDILLNRNRQEAYRCLYVACTRPKKVLVLG